MNIEPKSVVALTYDLYTSENGEEVFIEKATEDNPLIFLYGQGVMLPKFEQNLSGLGPGDTYDFALKAEDAYGIVDEEAVANLPIDMFKEMDMPEIGSVLPLQDNQGNQFMARVTEINKESVNVDLNHALAGKDLRFTGKILKVRGATPDELSHGHVHGIDGHSGH